MPSSKYNLAMRLEIALLFLINGVFGANENGKYTSSAQKTVPIHSHNFLAITETPKEQPEDATQNSSDNPPVSATPLRYDEDYPFPSTCTPRFNFVSQMDVVCMEELRISDAGYPYLPLADGNKYDSQHIACRSMCSMLDDCIAYSWETKYLDNAKELIIQSETRCHLCASNYDAATGLYQTRPVDDGKTSIFGYKWLTDYSQDTIVQRPCDETDSCAMKNNGFAHGEVCAGANDPIVRYHEFAPGSQSSTNDQYLAACLLHLYNEVIFHERWNIKCAGVYVELDGDAVKVNCNFFDTTLTPAVGNEGTASTQIISPMCPIPYEKATPLEKTIKGKVDCRDRRRVFSRLTKNAIENFDCNSIQLTSSDSGTLNCLSPIWETEAVKAFYNNNMDEAMNEMMYERIVDWCPTRCKEYSGCNPDEYLVNF